MSYRYRNIRVSGTRQIWDPITNPLRQMLLIAANSHDTKNPPATDYSKIPQSKDHHVCGKCRYPYPLGIERHITRFTTIVVLRNISSSFLNPIIQAYMTQL